MQRYSKGDIKRAALATRLTADGRAGPASPVDGPVIDDRREL